MIEQMGALLVGLVVGGLAGIPVLGLLMAIRKRRGQ